MFSLYGKGNLPFLYQRVLALRAAWSISKKSETSAGKALVWSCAAVFEENHAQCLWQNGCHGREWGLGSAEWIKNLEPSLCTTLGVEPVLGGAPARFVLTASVRGFESLSLMAVGYGFYWRDELAQELCLTLFWNAVWRKFPSNLLEQCSKRLGASCFLVRKLEDAVRFT